MEKISNTVNSHGLVLLHLLVLEALGQRSCSIGYFERMDLNAVCITVAPFRIVGGPKMSVSHAVHSWCHPQATKLIQSKLIRFPGLNMLQMKTQSLSFSCCRKTPNTEKAISFCVESTELADGTASEQAEIPAFGLDRLRLWASKEIETLTTYCVLSASFRLSAFCFCEAHIIWAQWRHEGSVMASDYGFCGRTHCSV